MFLIERSIAIESFVILMFIKKTNIEFCGVILTLQKRINH